MALILDTGPIFACLYPRDAFHLACRRLVLDSREALVMPAPVLVEVEQLLRRSNSLRHFTAVLDDVTTGAYSIEDLQPGDYARVRELCDRYRDADIGFVDAAVLAITERLNEPKLATLDRRHFGTMRPRHVDVLQLLPDA